MTERATFTYEPSQYAQSGWEWMVRVQIRLRRASDGAEVELDGSCGYPADEDGDVSGPRYMWAFGNYACDCNRHLFFERALGNEPDDETCGHGAYEVVAPQWLADACVTQHHIGAGDGQA